MFADYFKIAFRNIRRRKIRSWLTIIGIFIGIAAVVALISVSQGLQEAVTEQFEMMGTQTITVMPGSVFSMGGGFGSADLTEDDVDVIEGVRGIDIIAPMLAKQTEVTFKGEEKFTYVIGADPNQIDELIFDVMGMEMVSGKMPRSTDTYAVVVGYMVPDDLFDKNVRVGNKIEIAGQKFKVKGVLSEIGNPSDDTTLYINLDTAREIFDEPTEISMIMVKAKSEKAVEQVAEDIEEELEDERGEKDFSVLTSAQLLESVNSIMGIIQMVFIGIASISLLVGGVGIMNTMYTSVLDRTKEIGIMKAIGAKNKDIMLIFLFEAGILGLVGGIIGCTIGLGMALGVQAYASYTGFAMLKASLNPVIIVGALGFSFVIGILSGFTPSRKASKLKPVDALRYE